jgi:hypothetical protein
MSAWAGSSAVSATATVTVTESENSLNGLLAQGADFDLQGPAGNKPGPGPGNLAQ